MHHPHTCSQEGHFLDRHILGHCWLPGFGHHKTFSGVAGENCSHVCDQGRVRGAQPATCQLLALCTFPDRDSCKGGLVNEKAE